MAHYTHNFLLQHMHLIHKKRALSRRLHRIFFFDFLEASIDTAIRSNFRKEDRP